MTGAKKMGGLDGTVNYGRVRVGPSLVNNEITIRNSRSVPAIPSPWRISLILPFFLDFSGAFSTCRSLYSPPRLRELCQFQFANSPWSLLTFRLNFPSEFLKFHPWILLNLGEGNKLFLWSLRKKTHRRGWRRLTKAGAEGVKERRSLEISTHPSAASGSHWCPRNIL